MGIHDRFKTDKSVEKEGIWVDYAEDGRFKVARIGGSNKRFNKVYTRLTRPHRKQMEHGMLSDKVGEEILRKAFVDGCLLGWEGITDEEGNPLAYNKENALALFEQLPELLADLVDVARSREGFLAVLREEDAKNS